MTSVSRVVLLSAACALSFLALTGCATLGGGAPIVEGSRVLGEWQDSDGWWAGTVTGVADGVYSVAFDDGTSDDLTADEIEPLRWGVGSRVTCGGYEGEIAAYQPGPRTLTLDADGMKLPMTTANCLENRLAG